MSSKINQERSSGRRNQLSLSGNSPKYQQSQKLDAGLNGQDTNGMKKKERPINANSELENSNTNNDVQNKQNIQNSEKIKLDTVEKTNENKPTELNGKEQIETSNENKNSTEELVKVIEIDDDTQNTDGEKCTPSVEPSSKFENSSAPANASGFNGNSNDELNVLKQMDVSKCESTKVGEDDETKIFAVATSTIGIDPAATSTPGKLTFDDESFCLYPRKFNQITGRRSIRPLKNYTPGSSQGKPQFLESYRQINTELDTSSVTDMSTNATIGSEVHNNSSFSFFGLGRKRERTFSNSQLNQNFQLDSDISPRKRARLDKNTFYNIITSPFRQLTSQFSKAQIKNDNTPKKNETQMCVEDSDDVQNVSGTSITENCTKTTNNEVSEQDQDINADISKNNEKDISQSEKNTDILMENIKPSGETDETKESNEKAKRCIIM